MRAIDIINLLDSWAPKYLVENWDNTGFQIGDPEKEVKRILLSLDLTEEVFQQALKINAHMIISHHPLIFKSLKSITKLTPKEKLIYNIIREDIVVYNAHTNLDLASNGVNDVLAHVLELKDIRPLNVVYEEPLYKLVVFVPNSHRDEVRNALGEGGAGWIGNYSHCTYNVEGIGTFMPREGTNPYIGEMHELEEVIETRIETIVEKKNLNSVINKMLEVHPYEEVAYDIYPLMNQGKTFGYGRIGEIEKTALTDYLDKIKENLDIEHLIVYGGPIDKEIEKVAVCGGSGSSFIYDAYLNKADVYITGDIKYHDAQYAKELGLIIVDAGHFHTEKVILPTIKKYLDDKIKGDVQIDIFKQSSPHCVVY
ncbi:dinuclear metal center YbgI/SA1388 family protein [Keratinibaculum paraultunense]|uniref:GTP cyclohydrolase 1 type 2 homolog n=1 Tax=Keratinibaculum paraultunense TaxID=1278232 RepID=A0A4R3KZI0_9FIRM|nr:Nif3-like dinuclear metal center hexameric protein [Keratinibaculum paraultunense]QQY80490.1 Nif3-like dinuclear metal center hexameric protein [Keratinibaculum paraultunense]TCS91209.1 dinuclear metal center YbgI/SA1388 family protein [Keratinibaculum paraultunense]